VSVIVDDDDDDGVVKELASSPLDGNAFNGGLRCLSGVG
jgi:hypothetical protein